MELRHLRYFAAVAQELHFGRAASRLRIAQPALSQQVRRLEEELGVQLFSRAKRRVALTHAGRVFLLEAEQILARAEAAAEAARRADRGEIGALTVACGPVSSHLMLPFVLPRYRARFPQVGIRLREGMTMDVVSAVEDGTSDVGLLLSYFHSETLRRETILSTALRAALPATHPLARARRISLQQLARDPFILFPHARGSGFYEHVMALCQAAGFTPRNIEGVEHFRTLLLMVAAGYGVSLVPATPAVIATQDCAFVRLAEPSATIDLSVVWRPDESSPHVDGFLSIVREACRQATRRT